jgi:hypothetical protein
MRQPNWAVEKVQSFEPREDWVMDNARCDAVGRAIVVRSRMLTVARQRRNGVDGTDISERALRESYGRRPVVVAAKRACQSRRQIPGPLGRRHCRCTAWAQSERWWRACNAEGSAPCGGCLDARAWEWEEERAEAQGCGRWHCYLNNVV